MNAYDEIQVILEKLPRQLCIRFALYCCNDIKDLMNDAAIKAVELTQLWLDTDGAGVTTKELRVTADAAHVAVTAAYIANAAHTAAYTAYAVYAASAADAVANTAAYVAAIAAYAANAAHAANAANRDEKMSQYKAYLLKMAAELTELEKLIYDLNMEAN